MTWNENGSGNRVASQIHDVVEAVVPTACLQAPVVDTTTATKVQAWTRCQPPIAGLGAGGTVRRKISHSGPVEQLPRLAKE